MKYSIFPIIIVLFSISFIFHACQSDKPAEERQESNNNLKEVVKEEKSVSTVAPPSIDSTSIDSIVPITKVERPILLPPSIKFETPVYQFDTITSGDIISYEFKFSNEGERPLEITKVNASCGCTTPGWPFLPFTKGETGSIKARFNSSGKKGKQESTITVISNAKNAEVKLKLVGYVKELE